MQAPCQHGTPSQSLCQSAAALVPGRAASAKQDIPAKAESEDCHEGGHEGEARIARAGPPAAFGRRVGGLGSPSGPRAHGRGRTDGPARTRAHAGAAGVVYQGHGAVSPWPGIDSDFGSVSVAVDGL